MSIWPGLMRLGNGFGKGLRPAPPAADTRARDAGAVALDEVGVVHRGRSMLQDGMDAADADSTAVNVADAS